MIYKITWMPKAKQSLKKFKNKNIIFRIIKKVESIKSDPYHFIENLENVNAKKLRIGDYRVILFVDEEKKEIGIFKVGHKKNIYKKLK